MAKKRKIEELKTPLPESDAIVLFAARCFEWRTNELPSREKLIEEACKEKQAEGRQRGKPLSRDTVTRGAIPHLEKTKWKAENEPYLIHEAGTYRANKEAVLTDPITARLLLFVDARDFARDNDLLVWMHDELKQNRGRSTHPENKEVFEQECRRALNQRLELLESHQYLVKTSDMYKSSDRINFERRYVQKLSHLETFKVEHEDARSAQPAPPPSSLDLP